MRLGPLFLILAVAAASGGCAAAARPSPSFCDGIDAADGGCAPDRPSFTALTCEGVGREFGRQLQSRLLAVYSSPPEVNGETRAVRAGRVTALTISLANLYLRNTGTTGPCSADAFVRAAESEFGPELRAQAGKYLADGPEVTYQAWLADLRGMASILDADRSTAPPPSEASAS